MELIKTANLLKPVNDYLYDNFVKGFNKFIQGKQVTENTVTDYFKFLKKSEYSPAYQKLAKVALKKAVKKTMPLDYMENEKLDVFFKSIKTDKQDLSVSETQVINKADLKKLIASSPERMGLFIRFMYNSGCRVSEMLNVKVKNCTLDKNAVFIQIIGKGRKQRTLTISLDLFDKIKTVFDSKDFLFQNPKSESGKFSRQYVSREINFYSLRAIQKNLSAHCLRHSRATHLLKDKEPIEAVSKFLGHANIITTLAIYSHNRIETNKILNTGV
ncbi:MAG: tyrosine-type recombinase/integrase [Spirochaetia bacterium]|nr:tyrosine-type recombinase/integrase [Spirochaetia bacterium]